MLRSSYEFLEKLQEINLNSNQVMVSFDVKFLFTNVPLQETIDLISNKIYDKNSNANRLPIKKKIFKKLLNLATKGIFLYKDKLYQQIDGVSMGSPLGPTIANFFLAETETRLLQQQLNSAPKVYFRYVDDIVATNQLARAKDSCDERRRCASMRVNVFYDFVRAVFV